MSIKVFYNKNNLQIIMANYAKNSAGDLNSNKKEFENLALFFIDEACKYFPDNHIMDTGDLFIRSKPLTFKENGDEYDSLSIDFMSKADFNLPEDVLLMENYGS